MFFKMTEEMKAQLKPILGDNLDKVYDEDAFKGVIGERDSAKNRVRELDAQLTAFNGKKVLAPEEVPEWDEFLHWKKNGKKGDPANPDELTQLRTTLETQHRNELAARDNDIQFFSGAMTQLMRDKEIESAAALLDFKEPTVAVKLLKDNVKIEVVESNGQKKVVAYVVDDQGTKRFDNGGHELTVKGAVELLANEKPYLRKNWMPRGSGAGGGSDSGGEHETPKQRMAQLDATEKEARASGDTAKLMQIENQRAALRRVLQQK